MNNNRLPITRLSKFFGQDDFDLNVQMGQEYLHGDLNMKLVLYRVDRQNTDTDNVYAEVGKDQVKFFSPVEFNALVKIEESKNNSYKQGMVRYNEPGNIIISVYIKHLEELKINIRYGDYIGYPESENKVRYYTVSNDGIVTSDNKHNMFGFKPHYRTITCVPAQESEFRGI
jgi:hypothetical protein